MNSKRQVLIAGNWKMNHGLKETREYFAQFAKLNTPASATHLQEDLLQICVIPPCLILQEAVELAARLPFPVHISAQNAHWEKSGAFTGEISGPMLREIGVHWALVGHSERRQYFGETDQTVKKRSESLLDQGFHVILCIGETKAEREGGKTHEVLARQLRDGLPQEGAQEWCGDGRLILAYEPVWAIGTGLTATPAQAEEAHHYIREWIAKECGPTVAETLRILYGGSVTPQNTAALLQCENIDGALVGGASLKPESFFQIIAAVGAQ